MEVVKKREDIIQKRCEFRVASVLHQEQSIFQYTSGFFMTDTFYFNGPIFYESSFSSSFVLLLPAHLVFFYSQLTLSLRY